MSFKPLRKGHAARVVRVTGAGAKAQPPRSPYRGDGWEQVEAASKSLTTIRMEILRFLSRTLGRGPSCPGTIVDVLKLDKKDVSYHLRNLYRLGLVDCERTGTHVLYWLTKSVNVTKAEGSVEIVIKYPRCQVISRVPEVEVV